MKRKKDRAEAAPASSEQFSMWASSAAIKRWQGMSKAKRSAVWKANREKAKAAGKKCGGWPKGKPRKAKS